MYRIPMRVDGAGNVSLPVAEMMSGGPRRKRQDYMVKAGRITEHGSPLYTVATQAVYQSGPSTAVREKFRQQRTR